MANRPITEKDSLYDHIESMDTIDILQNINMEDRKVAEAVQKIVSTIAQFVDELAERMKEGGRLFYIGAGTSGRLGILDASECPPTYGVPPDLVIGIIAGGDKAIRNSVEKAEDDESQAWKDLEQHGVSTMDTIVGIAASGTTPYVIGGLRRAGSEGLLTGCITCNPGSPLSEVSQYSIEVNVGPEFITGSTRMKSGTAQKMILNMISTSVMVRLGRVKGNKMVDMQLSNNKLVGRGTRIISEQLGISEEEARALLERYGSVRLAIDNYLNY
ncbi:MAG: N-acetylmuramic acid 6-phosphate etherase [Bacteroidota bacterium]